MENESKMVNKRNITLPCSRGDILYWTDDNKVILQVVCMGVIWSDEDDSSSIKIHFKYINPRGSKFDYSEYFDAGYLDDMRLFTTREKAEKKNKEQ